MQKTQKQEKEKKNHGEEWFNSVCRNVTTEKVKNTNEEQQKQYLSPEMKNYNCVIERKIIETVYG